MRPLPCVLEIRWPDRRLSLDGESARTCGSRMVCEVLSRSVVDTTLASTGRRAEQTIVEQSETRPKGPCCRRHRGETPLLTGNCQKLSSEYDNQRQRHCQGKHLTQKGEQERSHRHTKCDDDDACNRSSFGRPSGEGEANKVSVEGEGSGCQIWQSYQG